MITPVQDSRTKGGDPLGAHRRVLSGLDVPKRFGEGEIQNRNRADRNEVTFGTNVISFK